MNRRDRPRTFRSLLMLFLVLQLAVVPLLGTAPAGAAKPRFSIAGVHYYENGAIYPISGHVKESFVFAIKYQDTDGTPPKKGYPRLLIDVDGNGQFDTGDDLNLTMDPMKSDLPSYGLGVNYARQWVFDDPGTYAFGFYVLNEDNETASIGPFYGPVVLPPEHVFADPWVELGLYGLLIMVFSIIFFVLGMAQAQAMARRSRGRRRNKIM
jgi:hypothetical protein